MDFMPSDLNNESEAFASLDYLSTMHVPDGGVDCVDYGYIQDAKHLSATDVVTEEMTPMSVLGINQVIDDEAKNGRCQEEQTEFPGIVDHVDFETSCAVNGMDADSEQMTEKEDNQMIDADDCDDNGGDIDDEDDNDEDEEDSEKDDKVDEDDDDMTKKLLSIQVLPRIPKIKRTDTAGSGTSSESVMSQRSVLERAEVITKSSGYPNWPKSGGSQNDDKPRWRKDVKGKESNTGQRGKRPHESNIGLPDRTNGHAYGRSSGSSFKRATDFDRTKSTDFDRMKSTDFDRTKSTDFDRTKSTDFDRTKSNDFDRSKSFFTKRVPCEMLFDAVMAKENPQKASVAEKESNGKKPSGFSSLPGDSDEQRSSQHNRAAHRQSSDNRRGSPFDAKTQKTDKSHSAISHPTNNRHLENNPMKENKSQHLESQQTSRRKDRLSAPNQTQLSDIKFPEPSFFTSPPTVTSNGSSSFENPAFASSHHQNGNPSSVRQQNVLQDCVTTPAVASSSSPVGSTAPPQAAPPSLITFRNSDSNALSEDTQFKRPSIQRVPRSRNLAQNALHKATSDGSSSVGADVFPKQLDIGNCEKFNSKHLQETQQETMERRATNDSGASLGSSRNDGRPSPLPHLLLQSVQPHLDSSVEVVDMEVVASPLCDDNLMFSDPVASTNSGSNVTTRKVVTFDCPEDAGKGAAKKQKAPKTQNEEAQRTSFETKCDIQQQVVSEMKEILRPLYSKRKISKEEYKEIMRQAVPKICHNRKARVASSRIKKYADKYTSRVLRSRKVPPKEVENGKNSVPTTASS